jgi:hypothetical protein
MLRHVLQRVFSTLAPPPPLASLPHNQLPNQLQGLPTELLQYVPGFIPLFSVAALVLSSQFILAKLGTSYFIQLKKETLPLVTSSSYGPFTMLSQREQELEGFLILPDRDSRDTTYCFCCRKIHDPMKTLKDSGRAKQRACTVWDVRDLLPSITISIKISAFLDSKWSWRVRKDLGWTALSSSASYEEHAPTIASECLTNGLPTKWLPTPKLPPVTFYYGPCTDYFSNRNRILSFRATRWRSAPMFVH